MTSLLLSISTSPILYALLSALNMLMTVSFVVVVTLLIFRLCPRRHWYLYAIALTAAVVSGALRPYAFAASLDAVQMWNIAATLLPYFCTLLFFPVRVLWKPLLVSLGYEFIAAVKYVILLVFFNYDNDNVNDPLELITELLLNTVVLMILIIFRRCFAKKNRSFSVTRTGITLFLLIVSTVVVLSASLSLIVSLYTEEEHSKFMFALLIIPLFSATMTYAAVSVSKSRQSEKAYREQLDLQIRYYEMMEKMNEDLREFRHDLPKILRPFTDYVENDDSAGAKEIAQRLSGFTSEYGTRFNTGNYRLDTVLFCQQQIAQKDNITVDYVFGSVFPSEGIDSGDIYAIFPNALDNAIEACRKVNNPCKITITSKIVDDEVFVTISNPVAEAVKVHAGLPQTSKHDTQRHGYGFRSIKKAVEKYGDNNLDFRVENGRFILRFNLRFR